MGHSWGVCLPSGSSEQQEGESDCSVVSWLLVGTSLRAFVVASISLQVRPRSNEAWGVKLIFKQTMWLFFHLQWSMITLRRQLWPRKGQNGEQKEHFNFVVNAVLILGSREETVTFLVSGAWLLILSFSLLFVFINLRERLRRQRWRG